jgi:peptide/nickel transport system permease protein
MNARWLAGKTGAALVTLAFVIVFNFFLFRVMGDPTTQLARLPQSTPEEIEKLRADYGLDKPLLTGQFVDYIGRDSRSGTRSRTRFPGRCFWSEPGRSWQP